MKRLALCLVALVVLIGSCERRARVIPVKKFQRIYAEMYLADQWLEVNRHMRKTADTTLLYESIFRHYGYCLDDYYASVDYYMDHPDKYQDIMDGAIDWLKARCSEAEILQNRILKLQERRDSLARSADSSQYAGIMAYIDSVLTADSLSLRALMDSMGFFDPAWLDSLARADSLARVDSLARADSLAVADSLARLDSPARADSMTVAEKPSKIK